MFESTPWFGAGRLFKGLQSCKKAELEIITFDEGSLSGVAFLRVHELTPHNPVIQSLAQFFFVDRAGRPLGIHEGAIAKEFRGVPPLVNAEMWEMFHTEQQTPPDGPAAPRFFFKMKELSLCPPQELRGCSIDGLYFLSLDAHSGSIEGFYWSFTVRGPTAHPTRISLSPEVQPVRRLSVV